MPEQQSILQVIALHLIAVFLVIINVSDIKIAGLSHAIPLFDLMIIFYFTIFRNTFGTWFIFLLGVWNDALNGNPLGTTSLCYILLIKLFSALNHKMIIRESFNQVWQQFISFCFLFLMMKWLILSVFSGQFLSTTNALIQLVLSAVLYVPMHKFFGYLDNKLLGEN